MPSPRDLKLYNRIKNKIYRENPIHSAHRSGQVVKKYKEAFKRKYGQKSPYIGRRSKDAGLTQWYRSFKRGSAKRGSAKRDSPNRRRSKSRRRGKK